MKNFVKAIVTFAFLMVATAFLPITSQAASLSTPTNITQTNASKTSVSLRWDSIPNADFYSVVYSNDGGMTWSTEYATKDSTPSGKLSNLTAGKSYLFKVCSVEIEYIGNIETYNCSDWSLPFEAVTAPDITGIAAPQAVSATSDSITFSWTPVPGATSYQIIQEYNSSLYIHADIAETTYTISNLPSNSTYKIRIYPVRKSASGYVASDSYIFNSFTTEKWIPATPKTPTTSNFNLAYVPSSKSGDTTVGFCVSDSSVTFSGYEVEVSKVKGGKKVKTISSTSTYSAKVSLKKNTPYKYRIRYFVSTKDGVKVYGKYSGYRYFCLHKMKGTRYYSPTSAACRLKLKWEKVSGASGYTVYISKKKGKGYKKVKSLGKKARSINITKIGKQRLKKNQKYYVKVVAKIKNGKKTVKNDAQAILTAS